MKRILCVLLCIGMLVSLLAVQALAADFQVTYYTEEIYAGGILDMYAFTGDKGVKPFTYQWQAQGFGWIDLADNEAYRGTKTDHLQMYTKPGDYGDWSAIPFQCVVTDAEGTVRYTPDIIIRIYPTENLIPNMRNWGYCLYEPTFTNVTGLYTSDYVNYTASTYAGSKVGILIGSTPVEDRAILTNSEVKLTRQVFITENGHTVQTGDQTTYVPYTVGPNAVTVEIKLRLSIGEHDLGVYETKTVNLNVNKPTVASTATAKSDCSLLRYTYNESQKLVSIPKGATVEILSKDGSYYQVFYNNMVGYVGDSLLNVQQPSYDPMIKETDLSIAKPAAGKAPPLTCSVLTQGCRLYSVDPITWTDTETGKIITATEKLQKGRSYTVSIWLAAKEGYKFRTGADGNPKVSGMINGNLPAFVYKAYEQDPEEVIELLYTFHNVQESTPEQSHTCAPVLVPRAAPTCTESGKEAHYRCACGMHYADSQGKTDVDIGTWGILAPTGHTPSEWRTTQVYHYKTCTACGEFLEDQDHFGGIATCTESAKCEVCSLPYGNPDDHTWSPTFLHTEKNGHARICARCKVSSPLQAHTPGPAATEKDPQFCTDCGYTLTPAKQHTHKLTKVPKKPATCTQAGNIEYYTCSGCADRFTDAAGKNKITAQTGTAIAPLGHITSDNWSRNKQFHWRTCTVCSAVLDETKMVHEMEKGKCLTCGHMTDPGSSEPTPTVPTEATTPTTAPPTEATAPTTKPSTEVTPPATQPPTQPPTQATEPSTQPPTQAPTKPTQPATQPPVSSTAPTQPSQSAPQKDAEKGIPGWILILIGAGAAVIGVVFAVILVKKKS